MAEPNQDAAVDMTSGSPICHLMDKQPDHFHEPKAHER